MAVTITLTYNPYIPQLSMLINGKHPPEYSHLVQYADEDIWMWHKEIWDVIYSELRDDFYLQYIGTAADAEIVKYQCNLHEHCIGFEFTNFLISDSLQKRLGSLNQYLKKNKVVSYSRTVIDATFFLSPDMQTFLKDIASLDINNLFCSTHIHTFNWNLKHFEDAANSYLFILASNISEGLDFANKFTSENPIFLIYLGEQNILCKINESTVVFETSAENLISTVFDCFLWHPLLKAFRSCFQSIQKSTVSTDALKMISATEPLIKISVDSKLEVGKSNPIRVTFEPPVKPTPKVFFKIRNETIASTDNICILGRQPGNTQLEAYCYGSKKPFETITLNVFKRNRIKKLILNDDELVLGIGDTHKLQCDYSPADADNAHSIAWSSTNKSVITVDGHGNIKCLDKGTCRIICTAENVSAQCQCEVKPYLQKLNIILPEDRDTLSLEPMQEYELVITKTPIDSIDSQLSIYSSDYGIANVIGNRIIAKNIGTATITISNSSKRKNISFSVVVSKKKVGLFKSLFRH